MVHPCRRSSPSCLCSQKMLGCGRTRMMTTSLCILPRAVAFAIRLLRSQTSHVSLRMPTFLCPALLMARKTLTQMRRSQKASAFLVWTLIRLAFHLSHWMAPLLPLVPPDHLCQAGRHLARLTQILLLALQLTRRLRSFPQVPSEGSSRSTPRLLRILYMSSSPDSSESLFPRRLTTLA